MKHVYSYLRVSTDKKPVRNQTIAVQICKTYDVAKSLKLTIIPDRTQKTHTTIARITPNNKVEDKQ